MKFYVYKITCLTNGKSYVGKTNDMVERFACHKRLAKQGSFNCTKLYPAMRKYGVEKCVIEVLEKCSTEQEAYEKEKFYIKMLGSIETGYNLLEGGLGAMSGELNHMFGKTHSPEAKAKIAQSNSNRVFSEEEIVKRKSNAKGENNSRAKLSEQDVISILDLYFSFDISVRSKRGFKLLFFNDYLRGKYDITYGNLRRLTLGKIWKHLFEQYRTN